MAKPCTPHLIAQRVQLFELQTANVKFLLGDLKGILSFEREYPPLVARFRTVRKTAAARCSRSQQCINADLHFRRVSRFGTSEPRDKFFLGKNRNPQFLCLFRLRRIRFPVVADKVRCLPRDAAGHGAALLFDVGFERAAVFEEVHIARDDEAQTFAGSVGLLFGGRRPPV